MNEELQGKMVEILASIQTAAGKTADFAMEQLPDIAQSYIVYGRVYETFCVLFSILVIVFAAYCIWRAYIAEPFDIEVLRTAIVFGGVSIVFGFVGVCAKISSALLVWFAPKVWLLKELASLIK